MVGGSAILWLVRGSESEELKRREDAGNDPFEPFKTKAPELWAHSPSGAGLARWRSEARIGFRRRARTTRKPSLALLMLSRSSKPTSARP